MSIYKKVLLGLSMFSVLNLFANEINLELKKEKNIEFDKDVVEVLVGDANIVSVKEGKEKSVLKVKGLKQGKTELDIFLRGGKRLTYHLYVGISNITLKSALAKIGRIQGIKVEEKDGIYILHGDVNRREDGITLSRILKVQGAYFKDNTKRQYRNSSSAVNVANSVLEDNGFGYYQVRKYGRLIYLEGTKRNDLDHAKAFGIAKLLIPSIRDGVANSPGRAGPAVSIDVLVLSYTNDKNLELGLKGSDGSSLATYTYSSEKDGNGSSDSYSWTLGPFSHVLKMVKTVENTKVLANPRIVVRSGEQATFHSGKENFVQTQTTNNSGAVLNNFINIPSGILLNVLPQVDRIGQIDVAIEVEDSTYSLTSDNAPEKSKSKSTTKVTVQNGYSILLSGFKRNTQSKTVDKIPLLGDIPILGEIFKNRKIINEEENVMVLMTVKLAQTPEEQATLFSAAKEARIIPGEFSKLDQTATEGIEFSIWD